MYEPKLWADLFQGRTVIVGIGNPLRGDDSFGPMLIERLQNKIDTPCIDAGIAPENHLGRIAKLKPDTIMLVDVAQLGLDPGQYRILQIQEILQCGFTTHDMSSRMLIEFLKQDTQAEIFMLGVQPKQLTLGQPMSNRLINTLDEVEHKIRSAKIEFEPL